MYDTLWSIFFLKKKTMLKVILKKEPLFFPSKKKAVNFQGYQRPFFRNHRSIGYSNLKEKEMSNPSNVVLFYTHNTISKDSDKILLSERERKKGRSLSKRNFVPWHPWERNTPAFKVLNYQTK